MNATTYQGTFIDVRDGIRYHVTFTYQMKDGEMVNEQEVSAKELGDMFI